MTTITRSKPTPSDREVFTGLVERVTYQNADNGFSVVRVKARGHREQVTLIGHAAAISAGQWITAAGNWVNDRTRPARTGIKAIHDASPSERWA